MPTTKYQYTQNGKRSTINADGFSLQTFVKMNPNSQLRMVDKDGNTGFVPASNVEQAQKDGLRLWKMSVTEVAPKKPSKATQTAHEIGNQMFGGANWGKLDLTDKRLPYQRLQDQYNEQLSENPNASKAVRESAGQKVRESNQRREQQKANLYGVQSEVDAERMQRIEDFQKGINGDAEAAKRAGVTQTAQMLADDYDYSLERGRDLTSNIPFTAPTLARTKSGDVKRNELGEPIVGYTTEGQRVNAYNREQDRRTTQRFLNDLVGTKIDEAEEKAVNQFLDEKEKSIMPQDDMQGILDARRLNELNDPQKILDDLKNNLGDILSNETTRARIESDARSRGMSMEDYTANVLMPAVSEHLETTFREKSMDKYLPKNAGEYIIQGLADSVLGGLTRQATMTKSQKELYNEAQARTAEGSNPYYTPGTLAEVGRFGVGLAADQPVFSAAGAVAGRIVNAATKGYNAIRGTRIAEQLFGKALPTTGDIAAKYGNRTAGILNFLNANTSSTSNIAKTIAPNVMRSGTSLGLYEDMRYLTSEAPDAMQEEGFGIGDFISQLGERFKGGFETGAMFGTGSTITGNLASKVGITGTEKTLGQTVKHGTQKLAARAAGFAVEAELFKAKEQFEAWRQGKEVNFVQDLAEGAGMAIMTKITGIAPRLGKFNVKEANPQSLKKGMRRFAEGFMKFGSANYDARLKLTTEEREEFLNKTKANGLYDAVEKGIDLQDVGTTLPVITDGIQDFLSDKSISWSLRNKFALAMGETMSAARPRMESTRITNTGKRYSVSEYGAENELLSQKTFENVEDAKVYEAGLLMKRSSQDTRNSLWNAHFLNEQETKDALSAFLESINIDKNDPNSVADVIDAMNNPESDLGKFWVDFRTRRTAYKGEEVENAIKDFESENKLEEGTLNRLVAKDPFKLTSQEKETLDKATQMLKKFTYKNGEEHVEQSTQDGRTLADTADLSSETPNSEAAMALQEELDKATAALNDAFSANEGLRSDVERMGKRGERPSDILAELGTYSEEERGVVANFFNAQAKYEGFLDQTHKKIEDRVQSEVERRTFKGTINGKPDTDNMIIVSDGERLYAVVAGKILAEKDGLVTGVEDGSDLIIAISDDSSPNKSFTEQVASSEMVSLYPRGLHIVGREKLSEFRDKYLTEKEADASEAMGAKEIARPEEQQKTTNMESVDSENNQKDVEMSVEVENGNAPSTESKTIPLAKNGRTKLYHLVDAQTAIDDILRQPESKIVKGNNDPGIVAQRRINDAKSRIKGLDSKLGKRFETQDFTEEEAEDIIAMEQGEEPVTNMGKYARERIAIENEISYYDNLKKTWEQRKAAEQRAQSMASGNEPSKADELTETEFRNDKENTDNEQSESQDVVENEPDETTWDDMVKTSAGRKTLLRNETNGVRLLNKAKKIYGDLLDSDLTIANDIYELVAMNLPKGISWEGREGIRGLQEELGSQFKRGIGRGADTNAFNSYLAKKGEGISIDAAIHRIWESNENMLPNGEHRYDDTEIRDAVIDMFTSASKPSDITNYVIKSRIADAERNLQAEEEMMLNYLHDEAVGRKFGSAEEMMDYNDLVEDSFKSLMAEDLDAINEIFAENELYLQSTKGKEYEQRREESPVTEGAGMDSEPSRGRAERGTAEGNRTQQPEESRGLQETGEERIAQREEGSDSPDRSLYREGEQPERLKPRNDAERSAVASAEEKLAEDIANQEKKVREAKQKWDDAIANASGKADLFGADDAVTEQGSMFSNSEMGYDASEESLRRTASQEESAYRQEQARLEQLRSQQEHDSRIAGALENARGEQKIDFEGGSTGVIQGLEGYKEKDITDLVEQHFKDVLEGEDAQIVGMKVIGSRTTGKAREDSDLDVLLEYTGKAREDDLFNALNEEPLVIEGITVDINPITKGKSGTIEQFLKRNGFKDDAEPLELSLESPETNEKKGEKIVDTVSSNTEKIEDFGQKIGAAKKDLAKSGFERKKGSEDSRPAWQKKYTRVNVDKEGNEDIISPFDPSKPFVAYYLSKNNGRQRTNYVRGEHYERKVFNSEEEFDTILPVWEAQQQGYRVMEDKENGGFVIARRASTGKLVEYNHFDTMEDATAYLASPEGATELLSRKRENFGIPNLEHLTRNNMPDYRNGRDVTGDDFLNDFGFRGGEFGNWVNTSERQNFLNLAYDSLRDLADTIGISPKALSLGGELSIAFGARGSAGAKAHYEPGRAVINLTKMDGAGSLAHEWAHALDNYFGLQTVGRERTRNVDNLKNNDIFITEGVWGMKTRMEVREAFNELVKAMREKKVTQQISVETAKKQADKANSRYDGEIKRYREQFESGRSTYKYNRKTKQREFVTFKPTEEQLRQYDELVRQLLTDDTFIFDYVPSKGGYRMGGQTAQKLYELVKDVIPNKKETYGPLHNLAYYAEKVKQAEDYLSRAERGEEETLTQKTDFLADSEGFDKGRAKNYWSTKIEMFARGLESYVARKMAKEAKSSDYLSYEKGSVYESLYGHSPYPKGEDAKNVDKAFDKLFSIIQEKEVDGKRLLYRTSGNANRGKFSLNDASDTVEDEGKGVNLQTLAYRSYTNRAGKKVEGLYERINRLEREVAEARNGVVSQSDATRQEATGVGAEASASRKVAQKASVRDNQNRLTLLEKQLEEAKAERDNRFVEAANLRRKYSITPDGKISAENLERLFKDHNSNPVIGQLFDKVNSVIKNLGVDLRVNWNTTEPGARGVSRMSGSIGYDIDALARNIPAQDKAKTLLHEMIHQGTQAVLFAYRTKVGRAALSPELLTAARELNAIYDAVKKASPKGKNGLEMYGVKNVDEMVAELANPEFREALKNINYDGRTLWQKFKDCIHLIFGGKADKNALTGADKALDDILENFSQGVYNGGKRIAKVVESVVKSENLERHSLEEEPRFTKNRRVRNYTANVIKNLRQAGVNVQVATRDEVERMLSKQETINATNEYQFLRTNEGTVYGWHDKDGIHLTEDGFNPDTPVHEYTHGYMLMLKDKDSALYEKVVKTLKDSDVWKEVINDEAYKTIWNNETRIASEVASRLAGRESGNRAEREGLDMANPLSVLNFAAASYRVKRALQEFWEWVQTNVFGIEKPMDAERFVNMVLRDLYKGVNPEADIEGDRPNEHQFIGRFGAEDADKADGDTQRIRNLGIAESMEKSGKDARQIKAATGWERGKDGLWRYEIVDFKDIDILGNRLWRKANPVTEADIKRYGSLRKKRTGAKSGYRAKLSENEESELEDLKNLISPEDTMKDKDSLTLEDFIDAPELFKAYPEVRDIKVEYTDLNNEFSGMWNHDGTIFLEEDYIKRMSYYGKARLERELRSVLLHEIQHAIQELEGFAEGDNPYRITDNGKELGEEGYFHSAGEVEATNVESRKDMTLKERRNSLAEETEKYPRTVQHIYRWNEDTVNNENAASGRIRNTGRRETDEIINGHIDKVISSLHSEANKVNSLDEITTPDVKNDIETRIKRGEQVYGWYDKATGKVNLYMPNIKNRHIAEQTIWHETVGHKGMRELLGENGYRACMRNLYTGEGNIALREFVKNELPKNGFSLYDAIDEYLASEAEKGHGQLSLWQKVKKNLTDALHEAGYEMNPSISDVKYLVWLSKNHIQDADPMSEARRYRILRKLELEKYYQPTTDGKAYTKDGEDAFGVQYRIDSNDGDTPLSYNARKRYEDELYKSTFVWDEAHHDYMAAFRHLQEAIANGREIPDHMNAYMIENAMDSKIKAVGDIYIRDYCEPLQEAINECLPELDADAQKAYNMLERYMYMKHGLERNREFIVRDRINEMRDTERRLREDNFNATLQGNNDLFPMERRETRSDRTQREWDELKEQSYEKLSRGEFDFGDYLDALDDFIGRRILSGYEPDKNDKSGLTGLMGDEGGFSDAKAVMSVKDTEAMLGKNKVDALWEKMNAVTQYGVEVEYASGLISKANRDHVNKMFNWYLPLRKYNDATVTDMYSYINGPHGDFLGKTLMQAGGRHSQAELPIANALAMGENAIRRAARNEVRKAFLRFSREFKSDLVSETESWIRNEGTKENPDWVVAYPEIREGASPDEIAEAVDMFKKTMAELSAQGMARKVANALTVPYRINSSRVKSEHIVDVYVNGDIHHLVVNGNPRAAQAINGLLRPENKHEKIAAFMRFMSQTYTSWAPTFMARNAIRDAGFASSMLSVKEGWGYTKDFAANYARLTTPVNVPGNDGNKTGVQIPPIFTLFSKYRKGTLDTNDRTQRYFKEFVENGGVTGYIQENNAEHWQKEILKGVRRVGENQYVGWTKDTAKTLKDALDHFGESIENAARFATYMTSRQNGRTIVRSVSDAKEVSVNFNRKGAGAKTASFKNREGKETRNAWIAATTAQYLRTNTLFYNATVQSIMNAFTNAKKRPGRFISRLALPPILANIGLTFFNQWLHYALDEDDKEVSDNPYADLPEYTRRNNICLYLGHGNWLYLPLSIEHRSFYGLGDIAMGLTYDKRMRSTDRGLAADILSQLSSFSPVDYADSEIGMKGVAGYAAGMVVPAYAKPVVNAYFNTRWTGVPIQREGEWNKYDPEYKKAFGSTSPLLIDASKTWHEWWGGNEIERAGVAENSKIKEWVGEVSPGKTQYAVEQMGGEPLKIIMGAMSILDSDNELNTRNIPVLKAFIGQSDQQSRFYQTKARFYNYLDEFAEVEKTESKLKKEEETDPLMWIEHNIRFEEEPRVKRYRLYNESYKPVLDDINAQMKKAAKPEQKKALQALYNSFLEQTVNALEDFED